MLRHASIRIWWRIHQCANNDGQHTEMSLAIAFTFHVFLTLLHAFMYYVPFNTAFLLITTFSFSYYYYYYGIIKITFRDAWPTLQTSRM